MESNNDTLSHQARGYFLQQGQSINMLHGLLSSNVLVHHLAKWLSVLIEISLYLGFALLVALAVCLPTDITSYVQLPMQQAESTMFDPAAFEVNVYNRDFTELIYVVKFLMILLALPFLLFAGLLSRNRKKSSLIRKAFTETEKMKKSFDEALNSLKL